MLKSLQEHTVKLRRAHSNAVWRNQPLNLHSDECVLAKSERHALQIQ